jgi:hypothetical protein
MTAVRRQNRDTSTSAHLSWPLLRPTVMAGIRPTVCAGIRPTVCAAIRPTVCAGIRPTVCAAVRPTVMAGRVPATRRDRLSLRMAATCPATTVRQYTAGIFTSAWCPKPAPINQRSAA